MEQLTAVMTKNKCTNVFIRIENKYTSVENFTFRLDELTHFYPADNSGSTVILILKTMNFCPTIRYSDFSNFFTFLIEKIAATENEVQLFDLVVNTDLSCEWHEGFKHSVVI